jgi:hypothetical protein
MQSCICKGKVLALLSAPLATLLLSGCVADQQATALAKCKFDGRRELQDAGLFYTKKARYLTDCMRAAGYEHDVSPKKCQPDVVVTLWDNPYCYAPVSPLSRFLFQVELWWLDEPWKRLQPHFSAQS